MSEGDLGTRKTLFVLVIVVGCFAVLWPKVLYPMLVGPANQRMKPNSLDKGCCDVISDIDVNTIKIMTELCNNIVQPNDEKPLKGQEIIIRCRKEVLNKCGIDISAVLQEQVRLGRSFKQIVDEVRSFNGSLCLKYKFGVSPWRLGVSHIINLTPVYIKQERPSHLRPEMLHPALREKGRAIAQPYQPPAKGPQPKFVEGRPGPVPGIRPPMGGAGHVVHPPQKGMNSMGIIMPIYTVGIVIFFSYTLMKLLFKKKPEGPGGGLYPPVEPSMTFRREVFESQKSRAPRGPVSSWKERDAIVNAMSALLDEVDQELEARRRANEVESQKMSNGSATQREQPSVKVLGMEMTASCEGGQKWSRPESPITISISPPPPEPVEPPQEIYLEGALPAQSQILVAESTTEEEEVEMSESSSSADPAVVLASKMTLSVINLDSQDEENEAEPVEEIKLRNGDLNEIEPEAFDDEIIDESKYTTASGTTAAERDISEEERTDGEDIEEEIEKLPEYVVDNGVQQLDDIEDLQDDIDAELNLDEEIDIDIIELESNTSSDVQPQEFKDDADENDDRPAVKFSEDIDDTEKAVNFMSPEAIESIGDVIDDVINIGTRMSELRDSTERPEAQRESAVKFGGDLIDDYSDDEEPKKPYKSAVKFGDDDDYSDDEKPKKQRKSPVKFASDVDDYSDDEKPKTRESAVKFSDDDYSDDEKPADFISPEDIECISDVIDDVINVGTRMSELISAERDADSSDELNIDDIESEMPLEKQNVKTVVSDDAEELLVTDKISIELEPVEVEEEEDSTAKVETKSTDVNG